MPHPARSPLRQYSESTIWWECPICSKRCKSKPGRTQHIRSTHIPVILNGPRDKSPTATQSDHDNLSPLRPEDIREEDADAPEPMDFDLAMPHDPSTPVTPHPESD